MHAAQGLPVSNRMLWAGRTMSALVVLFMLFDSGIKTMKTAAAVNGMVEVGYPQSLVFPIGMTLLICTVAYIIPLTSVLGAILLTGYLGGATATMVRMQNRLFLVPVIIGVLTWAGLYLRDERLRILIPVRK